MDKQAQERFYQIVRNTYEITSKKEDISIAEVMDQLKKELSQLKGLTH